MNLSDLKAKHSGETIWVLGSGSSLSFVDPAFFHNKITVAVNEVAGRHGITPTYLFSHYHMTFPEFLHPDSVGVTLERDTLTHQPWAESPLKNLIFFPHAYDQTHGESFDPYLHPPVEESLVYGSSSLHGAMHLAAFLGAKFIMLVAADCGTIDGQHRIADYPMEATERETKWIWSVYNKHHERMKHWLKETYSCDVYSLNPFINFNLEGHKFDGV
jgi:hypothetical protein